MIWLELRVNNRIYKDGWNAFQSVWAPIKKRDGKNWPFWNLISRVNKGDIIFHLSTKDKTKYFIGYSIADSDGYITSDNPTDEKHEWDFATAYYRVELRDYYQMENPLSLNNFFAKNGEILFQIFSENKISGYTRKKIFYVFQKGRFQCLNGAYFSEFDILANLIIRNLESSNESLTDDAKKAVTAERLKMLKQRIGQQKFSDNVKNNYYNKCCFPMCNIEGPEFLIGSHIARWADNVELRGDTANGLSLCLIHDKAFEKGYFTLDESYKIIVHNKDKMASWLQANLCAVEGQEIKSRKIDPSLTALGCHWKRIGLKK